ncbi:MAG: porin [Thermodesulfobacteriota bacterium]|nr:porin [Thermodesulfobacteriota bacterium]
MRKWIVLFVSLLVVCTSYLPAMGKTSDEKLEALEKRIEALEGELEQVRQPFSNTKAAREIIEKRKATPAFAFWKNDFFLSTANEDFWMKIRGNLHFDTKFYGGNSHNPSEFDVRRARMDFQGMWYQYIYFRVQGEFADSPYIRNAWADYGFRDWLHMRAGQMKPPFSTSWWTTDNNVNFLERGVSTPLTPYFDRGWWLWGDILEKTLCWNLSVFTGAGMELDAKKGDVDDHKDYVGRLFYTPFKHQKGSALQGLHLCLEGSIGRQSVPTDRFEKKGYGSAVRDDKFWTWETESPGNGTIGSRDRWGAELHYIAGPFTLSSEYLVTAYDDIEVFAPDGHGVINDDGRISSWSTWASYFFTGEKKRVSNFGWKQPSPKTNFDPLRLKGIGAWEVLARYTLTKTSDSLFDTYRYADQDYRILKGADRVDEYTLGLAWTWNPLVRWQLNYVHLNGSGIQSGSSSNPAGTSRIDNEDMVGLRMIFKF